MLGIILVTRMSAQRPWQISLAVVGTVLAAVAYGIYSVIIVDESNLNMRDFFWSGDEIPMMMSLGFMLVCVVAPFALAGWIAGRNRTFRLHLQKKMEFCLEKNEAENVEPFAWPQATPMEGEVLCKLRPSLHKDVSSLHGWLTGARELRASETESWLCLRETELSAWSGSARGSAGKVTIDLTQPFSLTATVQPFAAQQGTENSPNVLSTLNLTITQQEDGAPNPCRLCFAVPVRRTSALSRLSRQDQRLDRIGPRDARPIMAALRYYADAAGTALPV